MGVQFDNSSSEVSYLGLAGWVFFNIMALITVDGLQMFSYAAAGFSAIAVGIYHIVKIYRIVKQKLNRHESKDFSKRSNSGTDSNSGNIQDL